MTLSQMTNVIPARQRHLIRKQKRGKHVSHSKKRFETLVERKTNFSSNVYATKSFSRLRCSPVDQTAHSIPPYSVQILTTNNNCPLSILLEKMFKLLSLIEKEFNIWLTQKLFKKGIGQKVLSLHC